VLRERCRDQIDRSSAVGRERDARLGERAVPRGELVERGSARANPRQQRVPLRQRLAVAAARRGPQRPERRNELIEMRAAARRHPLDQPEPIG
jgi:hypothetical protein